MRKLLSCVSGALFLLSTWVAHAIPAVVYPPGNLTIDGLLKYRGIRVIERYDSFVFADISADDRNFLLRTGAVIKSYPNARKIDLTHFSCDTRTGEVSLSESEAYSIEQFEGKKGYFLVQFKGPIKDVWLESLKKNGVAPIEPVPNFAYLVRGTAQQIEKAKGDRSIVWTGMFHPVYKFDRDLLKRKGKIENLQVMFFDDESGEAAIDNVKLLGVDWLQDYKVRLNAYAPYIVAVIAADAKLISEIAQEPGVRSIDYSGLQPELEDEMSDQICAGNMTNQTPYPGYNNFLEFERYLGTGVNVSVVDSGCDTNDPSTVHQDLRGRIQTFIGYPGYQATDTKGHGTHVSGIVLGNASIGTMDSDGFLYGLGVAPEARLIFQAYGSNWPPSGGYPVLTKNTVLNNGVANNHSWTDGAGDGANYSTNCAIFDSMVRDGNQDTTDACEQVTICFSAGNSGPNPGTLTSPKANKNSIIVGGTENDRTPNPIPGCSSSWSTGNVDALAQHSSRGPCRDNRFGVTVCAPGSAIASLRSYSCTTYGTVHCDEIIDDDYVWMSGTSMAAPHVTGLTALITEWWRDMNNGANPSPAMVKAVLINGAVDMGTPDIPNPNEGWGRVDIRGSIFPDSHMLYYDQQNLFTSTGQVWTKHIRVISSSKPLKITLTWTDAPGAAWSAPALVNDLDLMVYDPDLNVYLGNNFSNGWSTSDKASPDQLNNEECVFIEDPESDEYLVFVSAGDIAGDGVPYNGDSTDQDFALIISNAVELPCFDSYVNYNSGFGTFPGTSWTAGDLNTDSGLDYWDNTTDRPHGGSQSVYCNGVGDLLNGGYSFDMDSYADLSLDLTHYRGNSIWAQFYLWVEAEYYYDYFSLLISENNGTSFSEVSHVTDTNGGWRRKLIDLSSYTGQSDIVLRHLFHSDDIVAGNHGFQGAFFDDYVVFGAAPNLDPYQLAG